MSSMAIPDVSVWAVQQQTAGSGGSRREHQRDAVHAVALAGRRRAVVEHVTEMAAAAAAMHFRARDAERAVFAGRHGVIERRPETRPAGVAIELGVRREQVEPAPGATERASAMLV